MEHLYPKMKKRSENYFFRVICEDTQAVEIIKRESSES